MKVILLQHVKGKGQKGEVIEVSDGYAQNALLPKGLAKVATSTELNKIKQAEKSQELRTEKEKEHALRVLALVAGKSVVIKEKLNEKGSLYHALGTKEITKAIHDQLSITVPKEMYQEKYAIKDSGNYILRLGAHGKNIELNLSIESK